MDIKKQIISVFLGLAGAAVLALFIQLTVFCSGCSFGAVFLIWKMVILTILIMVLGWGYYGILRKEKDAISSTNSATRLPTDNTSISFSTKIILFLIGAYPIIFSLWIIIMMYRADPASSGVGGFFLLIVITFVFPFTCSLLVKANPRISPDIGTKLLVVCTVSLTAIFGAATIRSYTNVTQIMSVDKNGILKCIKIDDSDPIAYFCNKNVRDVCSVEQEGIHRQNFCLREMRLLLPTKTQ